MKLKYNKKGALLHFKLGLYKSNHYIILIDYHIKVKIFSVESRKSILGIG